MKWTRNQQRGLDAVGRWLKSSPVESGNPVFRLFGYAGTGKTTLAKYLAELVGGPVYFGAYTGKAAHVLASKGCPGAGTIHGLIYNPVQRGRATLDELQGGRDELISELKASDGMTDDDARANPKVTEIQRLIDREIENIGEPHFSLNPDSVIRGADLVVVDEVSQVDEQMAMDLLSFGKPVLALGDPAQLPPVRGGGWFTNADPDIMLGEEDIRRQARDNPIIQLATQVRKQQPLAVGAYGDSRVITRRALTPADILDADQLLVGKNVTRHGSNKRIRDLLGFRDVMPVQGDKLVCLKNDHDMGLLNGSLWDVAVVEGETDGGLALTVKSQDDAEKQVDVDAFRPIFEGADLKTIPYWDRADFSEFDYGYALTTHKAQGSQWPKVAVLDESAVFRSDRWRWLYTAITRAAESVTIVKM